MKQDLVRILRDIFTSSGYDVTDSAGHDLVAEKNGFKTFIRLSYDPDIMEVRDFADQLSGGRGLYIIAGKTGKDILDQARAFGLTVWSRDDMALKIGRAVLADMEGNTSELDLVGTSVDKPVSKVDEVAKEAINAIFGTGSSPHVEKKVLEEPLVSAPPETTERSTGRITEVQYYRPRGVVEESSPEAMVIPDVSPAPEKADPATVAPAPVRPYDLSGAPVVMNLHSSPVNVSTDRAFSIAAPHVRGADSALLKFVPFWKYNYSLGVEHRYRSKIIDISGDGSGCINALNGNVESMHLDDIQKTVTVPDVEYDVKMPVTSEDEARKKLLDMLIEEYTRDLRFDDTQGEAIISEHKRFRPAPSDIDLEMELVYVPVWEVKGQRHSVEINACSGDVLMAPVDDDVEFV